jgi:hypothetical protein
MNIIDVDKIVETIKEDIGKPMALGVWEFRSFSKNAGAGFYFKAAYKIVRAIKENQRLKIHVDVQLFDSWPLFEETAQRIFNDIVRGQIRDRIQGIEDIPIDIVFEEEMKL